MNASLRSSKSWKGIFPSCISEDASIISASLGGTLRSMRGMRNVLVHEYGRVDDRLIFDAISHRLGDFDTFKKAILRALPAADAKD